MNKNIVLIGMPGGGKSAAGRALARLLRRKLVETDAAAEESEGMPVADIFSARGEAHFRRVESAALRTALKKDGRVISAGGGIVLDAQNRELIRNTAKTVYLCAPLPLLIRRLQNDRTARPLLRGDLAETVADLLAQREPLYQQTARLAVMQNEHDSPADVAAKVRAGLRHLSE